MDNTVEIVVYIGIAVIAGGLILLMISRVGSGNVYERITSIFSPPKPTSFERVDNGSIARYLFQAWGDCGYASMNKTVSFQYSGGSITAQDIFSGVKRYNLCAGFSSLKFACGTREDLNLTVASIDDGRVYRAACDSSQRKLVIS